MMYIKARQSVLRYLVQASGEVNNIRSTEALCKSKNDKRSDCTK